MLWSNCYRTTIFLSRPRCAQCIKNCDCFKVRREACNVFCHRFWNLIEGCIEEDMIAPQDPEWIHNFSNLVPAPLLSLRKAKKEFLKVGPPELTGTQLMCWRLLSQSTFVFGLKEMIHFKLLYIRAGLHSLGFVSSGFLQSSLICFPTGSGCKLPPGHQERHAGLCTAGQGGADQAGGTTPS